MLQPLIFFFSLPSWYTHPPFHCFQFLCAGSLASTSALFGLAAYLPHYVLSGFWLVLFNAEQLWRACSLHDEVPLTSSDFALCSLRRSRWTQILWVIRLYSDQYCEALSGAQLSRYSINCMVTRKKKRKRWNNDGRHTRSLLSVETAQTEAQELPVS